MAGEMTGVMTWLERKERKERKERLFGSYFGSDIKWGLALIWFFSNVWNIFWKIAFAKLLYMMFNVETTMKKNKIVRSRFELLSQDPGPHMIDRYTTGLCNALYCSTKLCLIGN